MAESLDGEVQNQGENVSKICVYTAITDIGCNLIVIHAKSPDFGGSLRILHPWFDTDENNIFYQAMLKGVWSQDPLYAIKVAYTSGRKLFFKKFQVHFNEASDISCPKMNRNSEVSISFLELKPCKT